MVDDIIEKQKLSLLQSEKKMLNCFLAYTKITMEPYATSDELKKLEDYIEIYSSKKSITSFEALIKTRELSSDDLINFGYNMVNHFGFTNLNEFAPNLQNMFKALEKPTVSQNTIQTRLYFRKPSKKFKIKCIRNIEEYLENFKID